MKMTPKRSNRVFLCILSLAILLLVLGLVVRNLPLLGAGFVLAFGAFVFRTAAYRCPHCGYYLGRRDGTYCPKCRKNIE